MLAAFAHRLWYCAGHGSRWGLALLVIGRTIVNGKAIHVLLVEGSGEDALTLERNLLDSTVACFHVARVGQREVTGASMNTSKADVVLLNLHGPDGLSAITQIRENAPWMPVVVLADTDSNEMVQEAARVGAQNYLIHGKVDGATLAHELRYAIERKRAEEALQASEAFYHSLVESLPQNIMRKDLDGRFTFANGRFCNEIGRPLDQIVGKTDFDFFPQALAMKYRADDLRVALTGKPLEAIEEYVAPGGTGAKSYVQVIKTPVYDASGTLIGTQGIFWDVTEKFRAEEQLREANNELRAKEEELLRTMKALRASHEQLIQAQLHLIQAEKMESVGRLAAGVAHEVKNPLAILLMGLEYVSETCTEDAGLDPQVMRAMRDAVSRADTIIRGLVDFSADRQLDVTAHDLNAMIRKSLLLVKHELTGAHVTLCEELAADLPPARLDATKIQQVFVNVLMNAIHAMGDGGTLTVRTYVEHNARPSKSAKDAARSGNENSESSETDGNAVEETDLIVAEVDDTGPGIPKEKLSKVWDPFFTTKGTGRGTGLGLTVSRKIIELHGGEISIANRPEGGARVTIKITPAGTGTAGTGSGAEVLGGISRDAETQEADSRR